MLRARAPQEKPQWEVCVPWQRTATRESPCAATKTQCGQKENSLGIISLQVLSFIFLVLYNTQMLFILNVSHSYLPAFSWTHTPPWPVMITWHLFLSRSAWPSCCYTQWLLLSPHRTPSLSSCDPCPGFPGHHTLHVLFLSLPPVHSVSCAGSGLPSFLKMLQCPGALFPATSVSY